MNFNDEELTLIYNIITQASYNTVKPLCNKIETYFNDKINNIKNDTSD